jgi:putative NADPH-quinone reductase
MKIAHLVFHPDLKASRVNNAWSSLIAESGKAASSRDLYAEYPDFRIDVAREQAALLAHDRIVFQFPFYWYATPPLLKKWLDDVLTYNFAYGTKGDKLAGKEMQLIVSVGGPLESYLPGGYNSFSVTEFLRPLQQTATLCRMVYLPPMWMHDAISADEATITEFGRRWVEELDDPERSDPWSFQRKAIARSTRLPT